MFLRWASLARFRPHCVRSPMWPPMMGLHPSFYSSDSEKEQLPIPAIPKHRLDFKFTRSSGPGGQNVNKYELYSLVESNVTE